jgi:probable blue pigment (indigoidine) exporter
LLALTRQLPKGDWWWKSLVLGGLNFSIFWTMLFISAYRLPGGVAATVGAIQPLIVVFFARVVIGTPIRALALVAALAGVTGVGLLVLTPGAALDPLGVAAGLAGAVAMAMGTVLSRYWKPPVSNLSFTAWQLTAGGILLLPLALAFEPMMGMPTLTNLAGIIYLGPVGASVTYLLWFRGLARLGPASVSTLSFLSPLVATVLGFLVLQQNLRPLQMAGMIVVLISVWLGQRAQMKAS